MKNWVVGTRRVLPGGGSATFLGYRPRDDQSRSLGYEARNWFEVLDALGAYPATGRFAGVNDNTERLSRTTPYLACRFPNGAVAIAPHLREVEEDWPSGFSRDREADRAYIAANPPPPEAIRLRDFKVNGHSVTYDGARAVCFRVNQRGELIAFAGSQARQVIIDGRKTVFADRELEEVAWAPVPGTRQAPGGAVLQIMSRGEGTLRIPAAGLPAGIEIVAEGPIPGRRGVCVPSRLEDGSLVFTVTREAAGRWLYGLPADQLRLRRK